MSALRFFAPAAGWAVAPVRRRVLAQLRAWNAPLDEEVAHAVEVVVSELVTNGVVHVGGVLTIGLHLDGDLLMVEVCDSSDRTPRMRAAADDDESGRGLVLVQALAHRCGTQSVRGGKRTWAELRLGSSRTTAGDGVFSEGGRPRRSTTVTPGPCW